MNKVDIQKARQIICGYGVGSERNISWWSEMEKVLIAHCELQQQLEADYHTKDTDKIERPVAGLPPQEPVEGAKYGPTMHPLKSSNVDSFGYTHTTQTLRVKFTNGEVYDYEQVPQEIADGLRDAHSPGGFLAAHIKGSFKYKKL